MKPPKSIFVCQHCGAQSQKWLGRCPDCGAWNSFVEEKSRRRVESRGAAPALGGGEARLYDDVDTVVAERLQHGHQRVRPRARRRHRAGIARAARRRAGHRQVHAAAAGGRALRGATSGRSCIARAKSPSIRSRCAASGSASAQAPLYLLAETCVERLIEEVDAPQARAAHRRLDSDRVLAEDAVGAGQRRPGAAGGDRPAVHGEGPEPADDSRRARDERRQPRRTESARARRRHRAVLRRRAASRASGRARREEPLRRGRASSACSR